MTVTSGEREGKILNNRLKARGLNGQRADIGPPEIYRYWHISFRHSLPAVFPCKVLSGGWANRAATRVTVAAWHLVLKERANEPNDAILAHLAHIPLRTVFPQSLFWVSIDL